MTSGCSEANFVCVWALVEPGDDVVIADVGREPAAHLDEQAVTDDVTGPFKGAPGTMGW